MYEAPKLSLVGEARDVILGYSFFGSDFDGSSITPDMGWFEDAETGLESL